MAASATSATSRRLSEVWPAVAKARFIDVRLLYEQRELIKQRVKALRTALKECDDPLALPTPHLIESAACDAAWVAADASEAADQAAAAEHIENAVAVLDRLAEVVPRALTRACAACQPRTALAAYRSACTVREACAAVDAHVAVVRGFPHLQAMELAMRASVEPHEPRETAPLVNVLVMQPCEVVSCAALHRVLPAERVGLAGDELRFKAAVRGLHDACVEMVVPELWDECKRSIANVLLLTAELAERVNRATRASSAGLDALLNFLEACVYELGTATGDDSRDVDFTRRLLEDVRTAFTSLRLGCVVLAQVAPPSQPVVGGLDLDENDARLAALLLDFSNGMVTRDEVMSGLQQG